MDHTSFKEDESLCVMIRNMKDAEEAESNIVYKEIRRLRDHYGADLVGLITGNNDKLCGCGSHNFFKPLEDFSDEEAYFVATNDCATRDLTFSHEIGHAFVSYSFFFVLFLDYIGTL